MLNRLLTGSKPPPCRRILAKALVNKKTNQVSKPKAGKASNLAAYNKTT